MILTQRQEEVKEEEEDGEERCSKDRKLNQEGKVLVGRLEEVGWFLFNGNV